MTIKANIVKMNYKSLILLSCLLLSACGSSNELKDLEDYFLKLNRLKTGIQQKNISDEVKIPAAKTYEASKLREPFQLIGSSEISKTDLSSPLLGFPMNMIRLVGTLSENGETTAYVITPDNMVYQVRQGDIIGNRYGKVTSITAQEMKIVESVPEEGKVVSQEVVLQLKDE